MTSGEWVGQNHPWLRTTFELESESDFWDPFMLSEQVTHIKRKSKTKPQVLTQSFLSSECVTKPPSDKESDIYKVQPCLQRAHSEVGRGTDV